MARNVARAINPPSHPGSYNRSFLSASPLAEAAIARDLADYAGAVITDDEEEEESDSSTVRPINNGESLHSLAGSYRRPSFIASTSRGTVVPHHLEPERLSHREREQIFEEERRLLSDNHIIRTDHAPDASAGLQHKISGLFSSRKGSVSASDASSGIHGDQRNRTAVTETTSLLGAENHRAVEEEIDRKWEEAVVAGLIQTSWRREAQVIGTYAAPLMLTFVLQYSLTVSSVFAIGRLGTKELGAVSLASMTANITGYAVYQGLATSLDTLCAQAYGSGKKKLVGLQLQRMVYFLWLSTIPIALTWFFADHILLKIIPDREVAVLAGQYLKIVLLGTPGYACFESGKRYVQAQGLFSASLYVLIFCAPLNALMNWLFVWKFEWGYIGAPIAVAITDTLLPICLFLYVYFVAGSECWNGFTWRALHNWGPMIRLALPGLMMIEAECLAFEILTLASSYLGTGPLAAQSILSTVSSLTFQIPFPLSIAGSTRIANLIGATLVGAAKTSAKVSMSGAVIVGVFNMILLSALRSYIPRLFTSDEEVVGLVAQVLPLCAAFQLFDALAANCNGIFRGLGRQEIGGYVQLFCYYAVAMPISFGTTFGLGWGLPGLWSGVAIALGLVSLIESIFLSQVDWQRSVDEAITRNAMA
ncbi:hypothetical protein ASPZODRAFT_664466 [Penicilliopsis zonata CBS 506.65]|uniref:MATE efflux family protein n=1 Tax=Penicilliopsis zonata CBS 506.65 TaxID=1073090 RepID=A0A1L9SD34_9EURO|nr:hypothetical protein ASPZODRAFT_664466 [Penicilliopsis zonata CBS 506.65]OJJ44997.1 hypothetical protein ASPZODRAFT_664466 [Penicilliopsis zonata CBS 506.65]